MPVSEVDKHTTPSGVSQIAADLQHVYSTKETQESQMNHLPTFDMSFTIS